MRRMPGQRLAAMANNDDAWVMKKQGNAKESGSMAKIEDSRA